jgi:beta-exotoxin I transport system permease protein
MNIFVRELKANLRSLIVWSIVVILFSMVGTAKFSAYYKNPEMLKILDDMPPAMLAAFNMKAFNLTTVSGFFGLMFTYSALMLGIAAAMWGSDIISKEERDRTVEFALTMPVTRSRVVTAKALAALANCIVLLLVTWGISLVSAQPYQPDAAFYSFLSRLMLALFFIELIFLAIGILLGCAMKQYKRASAVAVGLLLGTYFLSIISGLNANLDFLKYFSPFKYFDAGLLLHEARFNLVFVLLSLVIIAASMIGAYVTYQRRDLYI